jgi:hypothetical protein
MKMVCNPFTAVAAAAANVLVVYLAVVNYGYFYM